MNKPAGMKNHKLTRHYVPEPNGGEGDEAEVEGGEEAPVLPLDVNCKKINISDHFLVWSIPIQWLSDSVVTM